MAIELTVILKDTERTYKHKFLIYETFTMNPTDPHIMGCIKQAMENLDGEYEDIVIKTSMVVK